MFIGATAAPSPEPVTVDTARASAYWASAAATRAAEEEARIDAQRVKVTIPPNRPARVLFSGDSLSDAWYASKQTNGFRWIVAKGLAGKGPVEFVDTHKAGDRVQDIATRFEVPADIDVAVVELGTNDVIKGTDPEMFKQQYNAYLTAIKAKSPKVGILCVGVWAVPGTASAKADQTITEACDAHGGKFADIKSMYMRPGTRGPDKAPTWLGPADMAHPNDTGHAMIAKQVLQRISITRS